MGLFSKKKAKIVQTTKLVCSPNEISSYKCVFLANYRKLPIEIEWETPSALDEEISASLNLSNLERYPCLMDGDFTVCGENAVLSYLNIKGQAPSIHPRKARVLATQQYWIQVLTKKFMPLISHETDKKAAIETVLNLLNEALENKKHIVGEFSLADIHWAAVLKYLEDNNSDYASQFTNIKKWLEHIKKEIPSYNNAEDQVAA